MQQFNKGVYDYIIASDEAVQSTTGGGKKKGSKKKDAEYGVSRGIDFQDVRNVLNFDFPATPAAYVHRVGRTARGHSAGVALSLICHGDKKALADTMQLLDEDAIQPYAFKIEAIEGFRYRTQDALRFVVVLYIYFIYVSQRKKGRTRQKKSTTSELKASLLHSVYPLHSCSSSSSSSFFFFFFFLIIKTSTIER